MDNGLETITAKLMIYSLQLVNGYSMKKDRRGTSPRETQEVSIISRKVFTISGSKRRPAFSRM